MKAFELIYFYCHCSDHKMMQHHEMMVLEAFVMMVGLMVQAVAMVKFHEHLHQYYYQLNRHRNQYEISEYNDLFTWSSC
jgi:hypothetical protein